ncbi:hypothetical protein [Propionivibrio sp.]|uniref:hypothetical protein n=1 Tax=Propionivibrio sp. TaxID=2212460 RepID=UPI003BEF4F2B
MRLLLDESVPVKFRRALPNHDVRTVVEMGWSGVNNGKLPALERALSSMKPQSCTLVSGVA